MTREKFPEKIPFRLTRMLTNAMEVSGSWEQAALDWGQYSQDRLCTQTGLFGLISSPEGLGWFRGCFLVFSIMLEMIDL